MEDLFGSRLLKWDFQYLQQHLPGEQKFGVMLDQGSGKIVMSHSARNGARQVDMSRIPATAEQNPQSGDTECPFATSDQTRMTFDEFLNASRLYRKTGAGRLSYFGIHLLWRFKTTDNGFLGHVDKDMEEDLWSIRFDRIKELQEVNALPLVQRLYLFAGLGGTVYHCHYDLQPNLHAQLTGRKRFILFPPDAWPSLYPFPVHHDLDRRSMVDLDKPDTIRFPELPRARGVAVDLEPGDVLYIPPFWWHHVQSLTPETTSMAMWFFEHYPLSSTQLFGVGYRAQELALQRDVEELIGSHFPDAPGEEDGSKPRPTKAVQVAAYARWLFGALGLDENVSRPVDCEDDHRLRNLTTARDEVQARVLDLVASRLQAWRKRVSDADAAPLEVGARALLQKLFRGRF